MISHQFAAISEIGSNLPQFECERWWKAAIVEHIDCPDYQMLSYFPGTNIKDCPGLLFQEKLPHRIGITLTMFVKVMQQDFLNRNVFVIMTVIEALHCFYCSNYARFVKTTIISWEKDFDFEVPWKWWACLCCVPHHCQKSSFDEARWQCRDDQLTMDPPRAASVGLYLAENTRLGAIRNCPVIRPHCNCSVILSRSKLPDKPICF